ncbi:hypothetical protein M422DRAFT_259370 [Sphaerobolus stellatus SS14]|uniref:Uncharacterized protein n=1 Tax=Sphaerobolus stellatus (strain SS14) TaxID=990650 RepID=A0A0C9UT07_SPHS4|nr:hypothetical protein M422DRAFT_259370 [Sphaerobolus stellatus SS14]
MDTIRALGFSTRYFSKQRCSAADIDIPPNMESFEARESAALLPSADSLRQVFADSLAFPPVLISSDSKPIFAFSIVLKTITLMADDRVQSETEDDVQTRQYSPDQLLEPSLAEQCLQICTDFRAGSIEKYDVIAKITTVLVGSTTCTGSAREQAIKSYLRIIDKDSGDLPEPTRANEFSQNTERNEPRPLDGANLEERGATSRGRKRKGRASDGEDSATEDSTISDFNTSQLPWEIQNTFTPRRLSEDLQKTNDTLCLFARDYKKTKISLLTNPNRPEFPESEWENIIKGKSVSLDKVLTSMVVIGSDSKQVEHISSLVELRFGNATPIKRVTTHGEWEMAWSRTCSAVEFVFAHRKQELRMYTEQIQRKFYATHISFHDRIILYDRAVRERVSHRSDLSLADTTMFEDLAVMHTSPTGRADHPKFVTGIMLGSAPIRLQPAGIDIYVPSADRVDTKQEIRSAARRLKRNDLITENRPRFARDFLWEEHEVSFSPTSNLSILASPLPTPPIHELHNTAALSTISTHADLFKIVSPIKVDRLEALLSTHPNQLFVQSICRGLREGFWPWATTAGTAYPITWDNSHQPILDPRHQDFLRHQRDEEISLGQYSETFGKELLPGMYSMPIGVVPKPHGGGLRLINDLSAGTFSLNSMVPKNEGTIHLDNIRHLGTVLRRVRKSHGSAPLLLFKSDVTRAYRLIPMHPLWQIKQIVTIDSERHVDRCNCFGGRAGGRCWCSFYSLILWIADNIWGIKDLLAYIDDNFSWEFADNTMWYEPYRCYLPRKQGRLLQLWDYLGIPHKQSKQVFGSAIKIIGYHVDVDNMRVSMDNDDRNLLVSSVLQFCNSKISRRHSVHDFQRLAGWINWDLNVEPHLRPGLASIYDKLSGKENPHQLLYINRTIQRDLQWFAQHFSNGTGIYLLDTIAWDASEADIIVYTDACLTGMGFWSPDTSQAFHCNTPLTRKYKDIFFFEALTVLYALHWVAENTPTITRLGIYCDSSNTVDIFNTLRAKGVYNTLLRFAVNILKSRDIDLRLYYIPGEHNRIANALSRGAEGMNSTLPRSKNSHRSPWIREKLERMRVYALRHALAPSLKLSYSTALTSYLNFCRMHQFPIEPSADILSFYTVYMCHHIKPSSVASYLSGIQSELEPFFPNIRSFRKSVLVQKTLLGCKRLRRSEPRRRKALELSDLDALVQKIGLSESHNDLLFLAQVTSVFFGLNRLGELVWPDNRRLQSYANVPMRHSVRFENDHYSYHLPSHKTDKIFEGTRIVIQAIHANYDPVRLFKKYLLSRDSLFPGSPELWLCSDGALPQRSRFLNYLHRFFPADISGHSLRSGGALALALAGTPPERIQDAGRWTSDAFRLYIRKHPILLQSLIWGHPVHQGNTSRSTH